MASEAACKTPIYLQQAPLAGVSLAALNETVAQLHHLSDSLPNLRASVQACGSSSADKVVDWVTIFELESNATVCRCSKKAKPARTVFTPA